MPVFLARCCGIAGGLLLLVSAGLKWFRVPAMKGSEGAVQFVTLEPHATLVFKVLCLASLVLVVVFLLRGAGRRIFAAMFSVLFVLLLFYPCAVSTWSPAISARASWLQTQHENLSWLGGDIFNSQEYKDIGWKSQVVVSDAERQVGVFHLPSWAPYMIQWGQLGELYEWLGYTNRFCQFVNRGWFLALAGSGLCLISLCRGSNGLSYPVARTIGLTITMMLLAGMMIALTPPLLSGWFMMKARHATHRGQYDDALHWLAVAALILPAIRQDTYFVAQKGRLDVAAGRDTDEARLDQAVRLARQGFDVQAHERYAELLGSDSGVIRREAARGLMREAIGDLNSGQPENALRLLIDVLSVEPCNLKALYAVQLAGLRLGRDDLVKDSVLRMREVYSAFNTPTKAPVLASAAENLSALAYGAGDMPSALEFHKQAIGWEKP